MYYWKGKATGSLSKESWRNYNFFLIHLSWDLWMQGAVCSLQFNFSASSPFLPFIPQSSLLPVLPSFLILHPPVVSHFLLVHTVQNPTSLKSVRQEGEQISCCVLQLPFHPDWNISTCMIIPVCSSQGNAEHNRDLWVYKHHKSSSSRGVGGSASLSLSSLWAAGFTLLPLGTGMNESSASTWQNVCKKPAEQVLGEIKWFQVIYRGRSINLRIVKLQATKALYFITFSTSKCQLLDWF